MNDMINANSIAWATLKEKEIYYDTAKTKLVKIKSLMSYMQNDMVDRDKKDILTDILDLCGLTVTKITAPNATSIMFQTEASGKYGFLQVVLNTLVKIECTTTPTFGMVYFKPFESSSSSDVRAISISNNSATMTGGNGVVYSFGYVSTCMDKYSAYQWNNGQCVLKDQAFNPVLNVNNMEDKRYGTSDIYLNNTDNFYIQDNHVYTINDALQLDTISKQNDGNFVYTNDTSYGPGSPKFKNLYAWGMSDVQVIPIYTNESTGGVPTIAWDGSVLSVDSQNYVLPANSKIVVYKRQGGVMNRQRYLEIKNQQETVSTSNNYDEWTPYAQYHINLTWLEYEVETAIHTDSVVAWAKSSNYVKDKDYPESPTISEYLLEFTDKYSYCEITTQCDSISAQNLQYTSESIPTQYSDFFTYVFHTKVSLVLTGADERDTDYSCQSYLTGQSNRNKERQVTAGGYTIYYYQRGTHGHIAMHTRNLYYCNLFESPLQKDDLSIWNDDGTETCVIVARKYDKKYWKSYTGIRMKYTLNDRICGLMDSNTYSSNSNSFSWFNGYDTFHTTNFKSDFPIAYNFSHSATREGDEAYAYLLACSTINSADINRNATYWIFAVPNN